jgi:hypothetical protein
MSNHNGTGFWVIVALATALSIAVITELAVGLLARKIRRLKLLVASSVRGHGAKQAGA